MDYKSWSNMVQNMSEYTLDRNPITATKQPSKGNTETNNENKSSSSKFN